MRGNYLYFITSVGPGMTFSDIIVTLVSNIIVALCYICC